MKNYFFISILITSTIVNAQKPDFSVFLLQNDKEIKIKNNETTVEKSPFALVYKFKGENVWALVAGSNDKITEVYNGSEDSQVIFITKAEFGGADGYFNEDKSIRAWDGEIATTILFEDFEHHRFDSIYTKGKWTYGIRTIKELSTRDEPLLVEDWPSNYLIIGTAKTKRTEGVLQSIGTRFIKLNLIKLENEFPYTVKGKEYIEEGEAKYQEGCEGCGNLGSYHFLSNGKEVDYLMSGSDINSFGIYVQKGDKVVIAEGKISFTVNPDGSFITDNQFGTKYKLKEK